MRTIMIEPPASQQKSHSSQNLKQILSPLAADLVKVDDTLRSVVALDIPLLKAGAEAIIAAGGKRMRPAILLLAGQFNNYNLDRLVPLAAAIELLHTASLVHDDTIDQALVRRGLPTLNSMLDGGATVLVGDYLFARSAVLSTMGEVMRATRIFAESLVTIVEGELEQHFSANHIENSIEEYYKRIYRKTGVLFAAASEIGAVLSEAPEEDIQRLRHYGKQVGMAFQIIDDILDIQSTEQQLGKPIGGDLRQGTVTLPTMYYIETANEEGCEAVRQVIEGENRSNEMVSKVIGYMTESGALARSHAEAVRMVDEAKAALMDLPDIPARGSLLDLADFVVQRDY